MGSKILVVLTIVLVAVGLNRKLNEKKPSLNLSRTPASDLRGEYGWPDNCNGKKYCVTVFVAPTCPLCKASATTFKQLQQLISQKRPDVGFGLIMVSGTPQQQAEDINILTPIEIIVDNSQKILANRPILGTPHWFVHEGTGNELFNAAGLRITKEDYDIEELIADIKVAQ